MMSEKNIKDTTHRFADVAREPCIILAPIEGFNEKPLVTLEEATVPLHTIVLRISVYVHVAKERAKHPDNNLSSDESAAIALYTMEWTPNTESLYYILNATLRTENRQILKPWFLYLKLLLTALSHFPSIRATVYRGVGCAIEGEREKYQQGKKTVWWGFSSCSKSQDISEQHQFLGQTGRGTLFVIDCIKGKDIAKHSYHKKEEEILLLPGTQVEVIKNEYRGDGLHVIHLREIESSHVFLETVSSERLRIPRPSVVEHESRHNHKLIEFIARFKPRAEAYLIGTPYTDDDMKIIVKELIQVKQCHEFFIRECEVTSQGAQYISEALPNNRTLERLFMNNTRIGDIGVKPIAEALSGRNNSTLTKLSLGINGITDDGVDYLAAMLASNQTLTHLYLASNRITDRGLQRLATILTHNNTTLQSLSLEWNEFREDASVQVVVEMLNNNRTLRKLNLESCKLPKTGIKQIKTVSKGKKHFELTIS